MVASVVNLHRLAVYGGLEGFVGETEFGQGESGDAFRRRIGGFRGSSTPDEGGDEGRGHQACARQSTDLDEGPLVHVEGSVVEFQAARP